MKQIQVTRTTRKRDLQTDRRTSRVARHRTVRNWIVRNQLGPTHNYVHR